MKDDIQQRTVNFQSAVALRDYPLVLFVIRQCPSLTDLDQKRFGIEKRLHVSFHMADSPLV
jgi:hypothetical protein